MKLDLTEIVGNVGKHNHYDVDEPPFEGGESGIKCTAPVVGTLDFRNSGRHLLVRGDIRTRVELECGRCVTSVDVPVEVKLDDEFEIANMQAILADGEEEAEEIEEIEEEPILQEGIFDLTEFLRQSIILSLPIQPLCDDACKGLCPTCGTNLNEGPCDCPVEIEASPFAALGEILKQKDEGADEK